MVEEKMSEKQKRFADEYLASTDLNAKQAAIRAGYSPKTAEQAASRLLRNVKVQAYIKARMDEMKSELIADQEEVLRYLTSVMRREETESVVVTLTEEKSKYVPDENGVMRKQTEKKEVPQIVEIPARLTDANKAAELLGRRYGLFTDKVGVEGVVPIVITGDDLLED